MATPPKETPHSSLRKGEADQVQASEEKFLSEAQTLTDAGAQEELHSSQTLQVDASGKALTETSQTLQDVNLSSTPGQQTGETY